ncbi:hypothetical protein PFISCL1PPCAC_21684, partial [Pristionchus fissidentatus]
VAVLLLSLVSLGAAKSIQEPNHMQRLAIFLENSARVKAHNANPNKSYTMAISEFSKLTPEEINRRMGFRAPVVRSASNWNAAAVANEVVPDHVDWREHGLVSRVKNQGDCGSCYAFAAVGALEGQHAKKNGEMVEFSEQNIVDCSTTFGNGGCDGGNAEAAFQYVNWNKGIDTEESYPYDGERDDECRYSNATIGDRDYGTVSMPVGDEEALKVAVATIGPISVALNATGILHYKEGVYDDADCTDDWRGINHAVLVVGYGTDEKAGDYWLIKNSWGAFGEDGYIRLARNRGNLCGIASYAAYPIV